MEMAYFWGHRVGSVCLRDSYFAHSNKCDVFNFPLTSSTRDAGAIVTDRGSQIRVTRGVGYSATRIFERRKWVSGSVGQGSNGSPFLMVHITNPGDPLTHNELIAL